MKQNNGNSLSRRNFLKTTAASAAAITLPNIITSNALGGDGRPPASERIVMGGIGIGNMGSGDFRCFLGFPEVQMVAAADVRKMNRERAKKWVDEKYGDSSCNAYGDFRELLARKDIDAVHIATPDHWHSTIAIMAMRNGKDVYCQKPETLTIREGREMVNTARQYGRVFSGGSQRVLGDTPDLIKKVWGGELGNIREVYVSCGGPSLPCNLGAAPMEEEIDWDMWLGPAPWAPYHPFRCSGTYSINGTGWRSWRDYSGGGMTDWGAHRFGGAMFAVDKRDQGPVEIIPPDGKDIKQLTYKFSDGMLMYHGGGKSGAIECIGTNEKIAARPIPGYKGPNKSIYGDFIHCVKTRERPFRDIEYAHRTCTICHLGNICYFLNRKLKWDPVKEIFPEDVQANRLLERAKREPWSI